MWFRSPEVWFSLIWKMFKWRHNIVKETFEIHHLSSFEQTWLIAGMCAWWWHDFCSHSRRVQMHQPGIEPGSHRWQRCILPLDHWCLSRFSRVSDFCWFSDLCATPPTPPTPSLLSGLRGVLADRFAQGEVIKRFTFVARHNPPNLWPGRFLSRPQNG